MKLNPKAYHRTAILPVEALHLLDELQALHQLDGSYMLHEHGPEVEVEFSAGEDLPFGVFRGRDNDDVNVVVFFSRDGAHVWRSVR